MNTSHAYITCTLHTCMHVCIACMHCIHHIHASTHTRTSHTYMTNIHYIFTYIHCINTCMHTCIAHMHTSHASHTAINKSHAYAHDMTYMHDMHTTTRIHYNTYMTRPHVTLHTQMYALQNYIGCIQAKACIQYIQI